MGGETYLKKIVGFRHMLALAANVMIPFMLSVAHAGDLGAPKGAVLLTISGKLDNTNGDGVARFDEAMLASIPQHRIETSTPWTDGKKLFEGVLLSDVLDLAGIGAAQTLRVVALNEYEILIPVSDANEFGVLLAMRMDGKPLSRRDKGPIWIVYPRDSFTKLQDERHDAKWAWQLSRIDVQ